MQYDGKIEIGETASLTGLRVLAILPSNNLSQTQYLVQVLEAAKARWGWRVDILCEGKDRTAFEKLAAPSGTLMARPSMLQSAAAWENDDEVVADVNWRLGEAELAAGLPTGQIALGGISSIGRAYADPHRHMPSSAIARRVRADNFEPFRIIRRLYRHAEELLAASSPDVVLAYEWTKPWRLALWLAATRLGIPCIALRRSKILSDRYYWTTDRLLLNSAATECASAKQGAEEVVSRAAETHIQAFRDQPKMVGYIRTKWQSPGEGSWVTWHARFARSVPREFLNSVRGRKLPERASLLAQLIGFNRRFVMIRRQRRFFERYDESSLARMKYVYLALHKETDLAQTFQASAWHDQRYTVGLFASVLPAGYRLLVREHRFNYGHRSTRYYQEISRLPNVCLIDPFEPQFKYISNADLIVTENGSTGWEGLLLHRRVLTLARTFYDGAGLARKVEGPNQMGKTILETLVSPEVEDAAVHDRNLGQMVDAELETTFEMGPEGISLALDQLANVIASVEYHHGEAAPASVSRRLSAS